MTSCIHGASPVYCPSCFEARELLLLRRVARAVEGLLWSGDPDGERRRTLTELTNEWEQMRRARYHG